MNRKENSDRTRQQLLDAAYTLFIKNGYEATALTDIVALTHLTRGAVYWHFKDKDRLFEAVMNNVIADLDNKKTDIIKMDISPGEKLLKIFDLLLSDKDEFIFVNSIQPLSKRYSQFEGLNDKLVKAKRRLLNYFKDILSAGIEQQYFRLNADPEITARLLYYTFEGLYFTIHIEEPLSRDLVKQLLSAYIKFEDSF